MPDTTDTDPPATYEERARRKGVAYRKAYSEWVAGLPHEVREQLRAKGMLEPVTDMDGSASPAPVIERGAEAERMRERMLEECSKVEFELPEDEEGSKDDGGSEEREAMRLRSLRDFLCARGNPVRDWAAMRYLLGHGTCEGHARALGTTKQAFNYHVHVLQKELGLPPLGNQRSEASRQAYAQANRRRLRAFLTRTDKT